MTAVIQKIFRRALRAANLNEILVRILMRLAKVGTETALSVVKRNHWGSSLHSISLHSYLKITLCDWVVMKNLLALVEVRLILSYI
jgi:hypothetical protein